MAHEDPTHHVSADGCFNCLCVSLCDSMVIVGLNPWTIHRPFGIKFQLLVGRTRADVCLVEMSTCRII